MLSALISLSFAGYVAYIASPGSDLFSWHPTLMSFAFVVCVVQAVRSLSPSGLFGSVSRNRRVTFHWLFLIGAVVSALLGLSAIYFTKEKYGTAHGTTPHGQLGFAVVIYLLVQSCAGLNVLFPSLITRFVPYGQLRRMHGFSGIFLFLLATFVLLGGVNTDWFKERVAQPIRFLCLATPPLLWALLLKQVLQGRPATEEKKKINKEKKLS